MAAFINEVVDFIDLRALEVGDIDNIKNNGAAVYLLEQIPNNLVSIRVGYKLR